MSKNSAIASEFGELATSLDRLKMELSITTLASEKLSKKASQHFHISKLNKWFKKFPEVILAFAMTSVKDAANDK